MICNDNKKGARAKRQTFVFKLKTKIIFFN